MSTDNPTSAGAGSRSLRSFLFVPGDSERKQAKALGSGADALLLDLEDSVAAQRLPIARDCVCGFLKAHPVRSAMELWVRVNALSSGQLLRDLAGIFEGSPDGIVLPKAASPAEVIQVGHYLEALETRAGREPGATRILIIATETPQALLTLASYAQSLEGYPRTRQRLAGLTWGSEDLSAALGVTRKADRAGDLTFPFQMARSLCVVTAAALAVPAIDGVYVDFRDHEGLKREIGDARGDGFAGKLAIHPDQVGPINEGFDPAADEVAWAERVVEAFAATPEAGVVNIEGQMVDRPHLVRARRILARIVGQDLLVE